MGSLQWCGRSTEAGFGGLPGRPAAAPSLPWGWPQHRGSSAWRCLTGGRNPWGGILQAGLGCLPSRSSQED